MLRIGQGWDRHRLIPGRPLVLGAVTVPSPVGPEAHSDGDVLLHALADAVWGAAGGGDLGDHFPPGDPRWKEADSALFLKAAVADARRAGFEVVNADATIVLEHPRLAAHKEEMRRRVALLLGVTPDRVSVKAKTAEGLDAAGAGQCVEAQAVVLLRRIA
ncbi:MAG: 2-C-methyl-D-erythritol 2,4-cyclodiphosphate synthase [Planctomycetes bacterium]|nr:2-C-methyl-D-erythritol 2,4-cyclodiphosphate synthase [Planctomycetota bacterium]